jgi:hypothetical protein
MADVDPDDVTPLPDIYDVPPVEHSVPIVTTMAKASTRGRGFDGNTPNDELAAVITTASARPAANGQRGLWQKRVDDVEFEWWSSFGGWTRAELAVLNRYRVRAMWTRWPVESERSITRPLRTVRRRR